MTSLSDHDLQATLSGNFDAGTLDRLDEMSQADLDAYREVWTALEAPPASFAPGFADRVARAAEAQRQTARPPWSTFAAPTLTVVAAVLLISLRSPLAQVFPGAAPMDAVPWLALALAVLGVTESADRIIRWQTQRR